MKSGPPNKPIERRFDELDRSFAHLVIVGYTAGFVVIFVLVLALLMVTASGVPEWADVFASLGVADRGRRRARVTPDGEQQLVLLAREASGGRLFVAPTEKPP